MTPRCWLVLIALTGIFGFLCRPATRSSAGTLAPRPSSRAAGFVGAGSCSASACHNGNFAHGPKVGSEYTFWITRDPHAHAYEVLFEERSTRIQKNLERSTPAHEEQRCLRCHVAPDHDITKPPPNAPHFKRDGVSCESCHGPAKDWLALHHLDGWRLQPAAEKQRLGMTDTRSIAGRARLCAQCHVGAAGMDVDHDLLAAGHPRLHFEFAAFHAQLPRHWSDEKDRAGRPDFEARVWALGQLASAQAALQLRADRAAAKKEPWPEFAEQDCAGCHHELGTSRSRQGPALSWGDPAALTPQALEILRAPDAAAKLRTALDSLHGGPAAPNRAAIARHAAAAALLLQPLPADLERKNPADLRVSQTLKALLNEKPGEGAGATERALAIAALCRAQRDRQAGLPADLCDPLRSRPVMQPKEYEPAAIRARLLGLKNLGDLTK